MILFFVGVIEMVVIANWTKVVTESRVVVSGIITVLNIFIWYYVLDKIVGDLGNLQLVVMYAAGCAIGTMMTTAYFGWKESKDKIRVTPENETI